MLFINLCRNNIQSTLHHLNVYANGKVTKSITSFCKYSKSKWVERVLLPNLSRCRNYSTNDVELPALTDNVQIFIPSLWKFTELMVYKKFLIKLQMDKNFEYSTFLEGAKQALVVVSQALSREDYESIEDLVTKEALQNVRNKINTLSPMQKRLIAVDKDEIRSLFPYEVEIIENEGIKKFVQITVVFYIIHKFRGLGENLEIENIFNNPEILNMIMICNYRFIRELSNNEDSVWIINMINQFTPPNIRNLQT